MEEVPSKNINNADNAKYEKMNHSITGILIAIFLLE
jgi:hypothetical protein